MDVPSTSVQNPTQPQRPPDSGVPAEGPPVEDQAQGEPFPGREGGEEDEEGGDEVVEELEGEDLRCDAEGGEGLEVAGAGRAAAAHCCWCYCWEGGGIREEVRKVLRPELLGWAR